MTLAFASLFWAAPANATQMTLEEAQAALVLAQDEVVNATMALQTASEAVSTAAVARDAAQTAYNEALAAYQATQVLVPGTSTTSAQNVVLNGNFNDASNWSNIGMGSPETVINSNIPRVYNGVLVGSYIYHFVFQTGTFPSPVRQVTFSYDMSNNNFNDGNRPQVDGYRVEFRTYNAAGQRLNYYDTRDRADSFPWTHFTATYTLPDDAVRWDVGFRLVDNGFWNGNFAGSIDNVSVVAQVATTTPDTYTYGEAETAAKNAAYQELQTAQANLDSANTIKNAAQARLNAAISEVRRLTQLVYDLTPRLAAPSNLTLATTETGIELSWTAPTPNLSGVVPERYAVSWSTTNFTQNGWGIASTTTSIAIPFSTLYSTAPQGSTFQFAIRSDNDTLALYSGQSNIVSLVTVAPPWWMIQFGEGETVSIGAPNGYVFGTPRAWYGSPTDESCGMDVSSTASAFITGNATASFVANNETFTDTCGGVVKVLRLRTPITPVVVAPPVVIEPAPQPTPEPTPQPSPAPEPTPTPTQTPVIIDPTPTPEETVEPTPEPTVDPTPTPTPTEEPTPTPTPSTEPTEEPTENEPEPLPEPEPIPTPEVQPEPELPITEEAAVEEISNLVEVAPEDLTDAQVEQLVEAALVVFETAEQGSPEYEQALEALAVAAEADDPEIPSELAAIPLLGDVAGAALEVFNDIGNVGADMAPEVREEAEKTVIASVIATGAAVNAVAAATTAASATSTTSSGSTGGSSSGGSSGGSGSTRRK